MGGRELLLVPVLVSEEEDAEQSDDCEGGLDFLTSEGEGVPSVQSYHQEYLHAELMVQVTAHHTSMWS